MKPALTIEFEISAGSDGAVLIWSENTMIGFAMGPTTPLKILEAFDTDILPLRLSMEGIDRRRHLILPDFTENDIKVGGKFTYQITPRPF